MTTFSQLVDKLVSETKRPDLKTEIATYLNQTLRELHMEPTRGNAIHFKENLKEDQLSCMVNEGFSWEIPRPQNFQGIAAVRYDSRNDNGRPMFAKEMPVGRGMRDVDSYYYRSGGRVFFYGNGGINSFISVAWYEFVPGLKYHEVATRPAQYDEELGWTYKTEYDADAATRAAAVAITSNWLLMRWYTVVEEGLRAKVYKRLTDTERARTSYSMYSTLRQGLYTSEVADLGGSW